MVFHQPHIVSILENFAEADILLGKPMPAQAVHQFFDQHAEWFSEALQMLFSLSCILSSLLDQISWTAPVLLYSPLTSGLINFSNVHSLLVLEDGFWPFGKSLIFSCLTWPFSLVSMHESLFFNWIWALKPCSYSLHNSPFKFQYRLYSFSLDILCWPLCFQKWWSSLCRPFVKVVFSISWNIRYFPWNYFTLYKVIRKGVTV